MKTLLRFGLFLWMSASGLGLGAQSPAPGTVYTTERARFTLEAVVEGLANPWSLAWLPDGRLLITERPGRLRLWDGRQLATVQGLPPVRAQGQGGLLEVLPHPNFAANRWLYFSYAHAEGSGAGLRVARAQLEADLRLTNQQVLWDLQPRSGAGQHFGGRLAWLPDGSLLIATGDRGEDRRAQIPTDGAGKLVRLSADGQIPPDNPWAAEGLPRGAFWSLGHRNIQGLTVRPGTSEIWATEHGPRGGDELNWILPGRNYGWPVITHGVAYSGLPVGEGTAKPGLEQPVTFWTPSPAPSGLAWYTGEAFPGWRGHLFSGNLAGQVLIRLEVREGRVVAQERLLERAVGRIRDVRTGPDGLLYLATDANPGRVWRLRPAP